ncbi:hypothetical protein TUM20985_28780 [Mycobacterium antarcticum]|uniref:hypothetical protein n=1 Tax=unclassified Mycolicibacterium TaxID=2636767 RepID=UPI002398FBF5|nr:MULTISPECIES: hypothetical protein [unclassified Mycolicibacterium]BDX32331.1 hypothetical protein TUM20985_28780 [Mycolicibacterium sp. TUM20985]GLP84123.1 hypothetical protein TUM20984_55430 [Mycolicibacterium sp. TUM20984]
MTADQNEATVSTPRKALERRAPHDDGVAWELAAAARTYLSRSDADRIYIGIGIGEVFEAIDALLTAIVQHRIPLGHDLIATVASWLDCYRGQDAEPRLRQLLCEVEHGSPQRMSAFDERFGLASPTAQDGHRQSG